MFCSKIQLSKKIVKKNELKRKNNNLSHVHKAENTFIHKCTKYSQSFKR